MRRLIARRRAAVDYIAVSLLQVEQVGGETGCFVLEDDFAFGVCGGFAEVDARREREEVRNIGVEEVDLLTPFRSQDFADAVDLLEAFECGIQLCRKSRFDGIHAHPPRMSYLLSLVIVGVEIAGVDRETESVERGEPVADAGLCEFGAQARFVSFDCEAQDVVFVCCDPGFGEEEVVREEEREDGRELCGSAMWANWSR